MNTFVLKQNFSKLVLATTALTLLVTSAFGLISPTKVSAAPVTVTNTNGYVVQVCKLNGPYGYILRTVASKPANDTATLNVNTSGSPAGAAASPKAHTASSQWYWGVVTATDTYAGDDSWSFMTTVTNNSTYYRYGWTLMLYVPYC